MRYQEPAELPDEEYPFLLITGRMMFHWHTGTDAPFEEVAKEVPDGYVEITRVPPGVVFHPLPLR